MNEGWEKDMDELDEELHSTLGEMTIELHELRQENDLLYHFLDRRDLRAAFDEFRRFHT